MSNFLSIISATMHFTTQVLFSHFFYTNTLTNSSIQCTIYIPQQSNTTNMSQVTIKVRPRHAYTIHSTFVHFINPKFLQYMSRHPYSHLYINIQPKQTSHSRYNFRPSHIYSQHPFLLILIHQDPFITCFKH